jgi:hypothetical protein
VPFQSFPSDFSLALYSRGAQAPLFHGHGAVYFGPLIKCFCVSAKALLALPAGWGLAAVGAELFGELEEFGIGEIALEGIVFGGVGDAFAGIGVCLELKGEFQLRECAIEIAGFRGCAGEVVVEYGIAGIFFGSVFEDRFRFGEIA